MERRYKNPENTANAALNYSFLKSLFFLITLVLCTYSVFPRSQLALCSFLSLHASVTFDGRDIGIHVHRQNRHMWISREKSFTWNSHLVFTWIACEFYVKFTWKFSREFHFWRSFHVKNFTWNSHEFTWILYVAILPVL